MLFRAKYITNEILANLINPSDRVNQIRSRFLSYERSPLRPDDFFLSYVRQLESLHRVLFPVSEEKRQEFADRLALASLGMSPKNAQFVLGKLTYGYEPSLSARLLQLAKPWKLMLAQMVGSAEMLGREIENIGKHRNFLAHELPEDLRVFRGQRLRRATLLMMVLARLAALQQAGFETSIAEDAVTETELYGEVRRLYSTKV
jgi:hypothetical protein